MATKTAVREIMAESMSDQAPAWWTTVCTPGITVDFAREVTMQGMTGLQQGFHSIVRAYRVKRKLHAGFRHVADRDTVLEKLKGATDNQGASSTPLVVQPINDKGTMGTEATGTSPFTFGSPIVPASVPLPSEGETMENSEKL